MPYSNISVYEECAARREEGEHLPDVRHDDGACGYEVSAKLVVLNRAVSQAERCHGHPAERLLHDCLQVYERGTILEVGKAVMSHDSVELSLCPFLDFRVERHGEAECLEHGGSLWQL